MVQEYIDWYDRHHYDEEWRDLLWTQPDEKGERLPLQLVLPKTAADLSAMGRAYDATVFYTRRQHDP